jgi:hypothetical protein
MAMATAQSINDSIRFTTFSASKSFAKYSKEIQMELFGAYVFGKKSIRFNSATQTIETQVRTISADWDVQRYTLTEVAEMINANVKASKGYDGRNI